MAKFLDSLGLARVRDWVRANFAAISRSHTAADLPASGVNAGSYGPGADTSPAHADSFSVPCITFDAKGRATAALNRTITLPAASQGTIPYGVCSEAANVAAKTVTVSPAITLANRTLILVAMSNSNTAANPTLNVNGLGAKPIWTAYQKTPGTTAETSWAGGQILLFQYNGSEWRQITQPVQPSIVTGIKGNSESSYRTGQVNLTAANIGAAASGHTHSYVPLSGGTITGDLFINMNACAIGSKEGTSGTMGQIIENLRYTHGRIGSVNLTTDYQSYGHTIAAGWYNYIYIPHRSGGSSGDNGNYGTLFLSKMNFGWALDSDYVVDFSNGIGAVRNLSNQTHFTLQYLSSTTSSFGGGTWTLNDDIRNYRAILISYFHDTSNDNLCTRFIPAIHYGKTFSLLSNGYSKVAVRKVWFPSYTTISFGHAQAGSSSNSDTNVIPYYILGIR